MDWTKVTKDDVDYFVKLGRKLMGEKFPGTQIKDVAGLRSAVEQGKKNPLSMINNVLNEWAIRRGFVPDETETKSVYLNIRKPFNVDDDKLTAKQIGLKRFWPDEVRSSDAKDLANAENATMDTPMSLEFWRSYGNATGDIGVVDEGGDEVTGVMNQLATTIQKLGYDGLTHIGGGKMGGGHLHRVWIAFEPTQIKSVDNVGTFDPTNPVITKAMSWLNVGSGGALVPPPQFGNRAS